MTEWDKPLVESRVYGNSVDIGNGHCMTAYTIWNGEFKTSQGYLHHKKDLSDLGEPYRSELLGRTFANTNRYKPSSAEYGKTSWPKDQWPELFNKPHKD